MTEKNNVSTWYVVLLVELSCKKHNLHKEDFNRGNLVFTGVYIGRNHDAAMRTVKLYEPFRAGDGEFVDCGTLDLRDNPALTEEALTEDIKKRIIRLYTEKGQSLVFTKRDADGRKRYITWFNRQYGDWFLKKMYKLQRYQGMYSRRHLADTVYAIKNAYEDVSVLPDKQEIAIKPIEIMPAKYPGDKAKVERHYEASAALERSIHNAGPTDKPVTLCRYKVPDGKSYKDLFIRERYELYKEAEPEILKTSDGAVTCAAI